MNSDNPEISRLARQASIETQANPNTTNDYLCRQASEIGMSNTVKINLCYVPSKLVISSQAFGLYLHNLDLGTNMPLESLAHTILDDLNNELIPCWIQIMLIANDHGLDRGHKILIEDRQPQWDNQNLLDRLTRF